MNPAAYDTVAAAIRFLDAHRADQPSLVTVAEAVGLSESRLQRVFTEWAGISPKRFLQILTRNDARPLLQNARGTFDTALDSGLSGSGRLHDLFVECEGVTPGEVARLGRDLRLVFGFAATPFGRALLAESPRGVCHLRFVDGVDEAAACALSELADEWPLAERVRDDVRVAASAERIFDRFFDPLLTPPPAERKPVALWVKGTNFQVQVWQALLRLPEGSTISYGELASQLGRPGSARAIGNAVGRNPVGWLIPCHRVIRETGALGGYRWGLPRKQAMLARESARQFAAAD